MSLLVFLCSNIYLCILPLLWAPEIITHIFLCHHSTRMIISDHHNHPWQLDTFLPLNTHSKTYHTLPFFGLFDLFLISRLFIHPFAPNANHLAPCLPICDTFCVLSQNMMSGEISPAIGPKSGPGRPFLSLRTVFLCPPILPVPQRTQTNPSAPIHTYFHPCTTFFSMYIQ